MSVPRVLSDMTPPQRKFVRWLWRDIEPIEGTVRAIPSNFKCDRHPRYWLHAPMPCRGAFLNVGRALIRKGLVDHDSARGRVGLHPWYLTLSGRVVASLLDQSEN